MLESVLRNCDGRKVTEEHVRQLANWQPNAARTDEIPFVVARVVLQDFTGVPLLVDLAAMRNVARDMGKDPKIIEPLVPVDLVVDHSVMIDYCRRPDALDLNMKLEFARNRERYEFLKWGMQAFDTFKVVPPGIGIVHQVNLEHLARGVHAKDGVYYPDTLVGTDSHTTMINGIGVVGWGVGGIEAEAGMLGQPVYFLTPDVVGVELAGRLDEGVTATDLVLTVTELLRREKVVGKFVEFFGEGTASLAVPDRATIANMAPEYGATMGFFPVDEATVDYLSATGRSDAEIDAFTAYFKAQRLFGVPRAGDIDYTPVLRLDLASIRPSVAGPKRPQDRIELRRLKATFADLLGRPTADNGFAQAAGRIDARAPAARRQRPRQRRRADRRDHLVHQHVEPRRAARRGPAREEGGREGPRASSRRSRPRWRRARGWSPTTSTRRACCPTSSSWASASPPTAARPASATRATSRRRSTRRSPTTTSIGAAVLSGNRNFEARIHPNLKANFLASPPLVVAFAIAGTVRIDLATEPLGIGTRRARSTCGHLAVVARDRRGDAVRPRSGDLPHALRRPRPRQPAVADHRRRHRRRSTTGRRRPTSPGRRSSTGFAHGHETRSATSAAPARWGSSATR